MVQMTFEVAWLGMSAASSCRLAIVNRSLVRDSMRSLMPVATGSGAAM
jgi:hypothetical protein